MKTVTLLLMLACLSTYGVAQEVPLYENITDNVPKIGATTEVYMGDRMLEQRTGDYRECIIPKVTLEAKMMQFVGGIKKNLPLCKKDANAKAYAFTYRAIEPCEQCVQEYAKLLDKKGKYEIHICAGAPMRPNKLTCPRKFRFQNIEPKNIEFDSQYFLYKENSFQQTIEYAGKSGNILKFVYSEFTKGLARDAFNREFQVDLSEGNVLAFKGALIEIESATNINIRYKVIRNFQQ